MGSRFNDSAPQPQLNDSISTLERSQAQGQSVSPDRSDRQADSVTKIATSKEVTLPRTLDRVEVSAQTIDKTFIRFWNHHHVFLPILDPSDGPNSYFQRSELLFWAIVGIGCSAEDHTLSVAIAPKIYDLAIDSLKWKDQLVLRPLMSACSE